VAPRALSLLAVTEICKQQGRRRLVVDRDKWRITHFDDWLLLTSVQTRLRHLDAIERHLADGPA